MHVMGPKMSRFDLLQLPEEIQELILSYLDVKTLLRCRQTCKVLYEILSSDRVWRVVLLRKIGPKKLAQHGVNKNIRLQWDWAYLLAKHLPLGRNLLRRPEVLNSWRVLSSGGDGWQLECPPAGADPIPDEVGVLSCFSTSYHSCSKQQIINLRKSGIAPGLIDELQPKIKFGEWYAGRFDCGCVYELKVQLLDARNQSIKEFESRQTIDQWQGSLWMKVEGEFTDYGPGARYIKFFHGGMDTQFWKGNYGSKMAGPYVIITL